MFDLLINLRNNIGDKKLVITKILFKITKIEIIYVLYFKNKLTTSMMICIVVEMYKSITTKKF